MEESKDPSLVLHVQGETRFTTYPEEEDEVDIYTTHSDDEDFDLDDDLDIWMILCLFDQQNTTVKWLSIEQQKLHKD